MPAPSDDIDEVALNVLLAEGVDLPTAWEASRRDASEESVEPGPAASVWRTYVFLLVIAILAIIVFAL